MPYLYPDSVLLIFCKAPIAGQVKTRLQPRLTANQAVSVHRQLTRLTLDRAFQQPLCAVQLYCTPDINHSFFDQCIKDYPLVLSTQRGADLGDRMLNAFSEALAQYRHAILIGCDCPSLTVDDLQQALAALQNGQDAVIAPAEDGGYVLLGLNAPQPALFEDMVWGNENVMKETLLRAQHSLILVHELARQWDVDTVEDWDRYLCSLKA
ncbi:MAG: TIGR04282 family arsenosugar biosynthesis glycosyltransferase [Methylobacter sp.]|nr:TIGR04282 family arsenosugar biosynthesis glycosyltransferase [Methylobacter sp.]